MTDRKNTRERILDASRQLFNQKGYAATTLAEIAASIGIAQGNLTYHFATKQKLVAEIERRVRAEVRARRMAASRGSVADDYVDLLLFSMNYSWENRFLLRDQAQFSKKPLPARPDPDLAADLDALHDFLQRMQKDGLFRRGLHLDLRVLARSLLIVSRYWMDHLRELEGLEQISQADQIQGIEHHFAVLVPCLNAAGRRKLDGALLRAATRLGLHEGESESSDALG